MKKQSALISLIFLLLGMIGCNGKTNNISFPFEIEEVENIEMYHFEGVPTSEEKKVITAESDIKALYDMFESLSLENKKIDDSADATVTSFRFNLSNGTNYELIYVCNGVKNGNLKSKTGDFQYFTSADIGSYWDNLNTELEATSVGESEENGQR